MHSFCLEKKHSVGVGDIRPQPQCQSAGKTRAEMSISVKKQSWCHASDVSQRRRPRPPTTAKHVCLRGGKGGPEWFVTGSPPPPCAPPDDDNDEVQPPTAKLIPVGQSYVPNRNAGRGLMQGIAWQSPPPPPGAKDQLKAPPATLGGAVQPILCSTVKA